MTNRFIIYLFLFLGLKGYSQSKVYKDFAILMNPDNKKSATIEKENHTSVFIIGGALSVTNDAIDGSDMYIFPSSNPQSEVHLSINKLFPSNILVSSNHLGVSSPPLAANSVSLMYEPKRVHS